MLVLGRKPGESVRVGDGIRITVLSSAGGQVRIGIEAPSRVPVHREEVYERIALQNLEAARTPLEVMDQLAADVLPQEREQEHVRKPGKKKQQEKKKKEEAVG